MFAVALEVYSYEKGVARNRLTACPLCNHQFVAHEPRWKHFLDEHDVDDVPALSGTDRTGGEGRV